MEFDDKQLKLGHLLLVDRKCRNCGEIKNLVQRNFELNLKQKRAPKLI